MSDRKEKKIDEGDLIFRFINALDDLLITSPDIDLHGAKVYLPDDEIDKYVKRRRFMDEALRKHT